MAVREDAQEGEMREREEGGVDMGSCHSVSYLWIREDTRAHTLNGYKGTYVVFNTITLSQEHPKMQINFGALLTQKHTLVLSRDEPIHGKRAHQLSETRRLHGIFKEQKQAFIALSCSVGFFNVAWLVSNSESIMQCICFLYWMVPKYVLIYESSIHIMWIHFLVDCFESV